MRLCKGGLLWPFFFCYPWARLSYLPPARKTCVALSHRFFPFSTQAAIELAALWVSARVILQADTVVDVFKDAVAIMFILGNVSLSNAARLDNSQKNPKEVDDWLGDSINKESVGLTDDMFRVDLKDRQNRWDQFWTDVLYFVLQAARVAILTWSMYDTVYDTINEIKNEGIQDPAHR